MASAYLWLKACHIIAVTAWMAGLFYLPRLFVYHADCEPGSKEAETFKIMERRLLGAIMNPAMAASWAFGSILAAGGRWWTWAWFIGKLILVLAMTWIHFWLAARQRDFANDRNRHPARVYRIVNELPTVLLVGIVVLVVVKPLF